MGKLAAKLTFEVHISFSIDVFDVWQILGYELEIKDKSKNRSKEHLWRDKAAQHALKEGKNKQHIKLRAPPCSLRHPPLPHSPQRAGGLMGEVPMAALGESASCQNILQIGRTPRMALFKLQMPA